MITKIINLLNDGTSVSDVKNTLLISDEKWKEFDIKKMYKYNNPFDVITEKSSYLLGFLWADGNLTGNSIDLEININDLELINSFKEMFSGLRIPKINIRHRNNATTARMVITDKDIAKSLIELGFNIKNKRVIPNINDDMIIHFIRGYFDGDGSIYIRNRNGNTEYRCDISGRKDFIEFIEPFILECSSYEIIQNKTCISKRIYWYGKEKTKELLNILSNNSTIKLERKYPVLH